MVVWSANIFRPRNHFFAFGKIFPHKPDQVFILPKIPPLASSNNLVRFVLYVTNQPIRTLRFLTHGQPQATGLVIEKILSCK